MRDILLVCRKELLEVFSGVNRRAHILAIMGQVMVFGGLIPFFMAPLWINETSALALLFLLVPLALSSSQAAMVFAGERERGTLESLLATPLSMTALFFGKALAVVVQVYTITFLATLLSVGSLNLWLRVEGYMETFCYSGPALFALLVLSLALAVFATAVGVLISLRSANVRTAQMKSSLLSVACLLPLMAGWVRLEFVWRQVISLALIILVLAIVITVLALTRFASAANVFTKE